MVTFSSAVLAGQCAVELQRATKSFAGEERLRVRIGLHTGEVIQDGGQLVGLHVNTAARIAAIASGDQILVSSITRSIAEPSGALRFDEPREVQLKGLDQPHLVSELRWDPPSAEAD
jgi:class 3 adenylate cyclase